VHHHGVGDQISLYLDPKDFLVFSADGSAL